MSENRIQKKLKDEIDSIPIPKELDMAILDGMTRAKKEKEVNQMNNVVKKNRIRSIALKMAASAALFIMMLGTVGNLSQDAANAMEQVPVLGRLIRLLVFTDEQSDGGAVSDGINLKEMDMVEGETTDSFYLHFSDDEGSIPLTSAYKIKFTDNPSVLTFEIGGIRMTDMTKDFEAIASSQYVSDIYMLMTLDDSLVRFNIVLANGVTYSIYEHESPAMLEIKLTEDEKNLNLEETAFSVRSYSYAKSENFAIIEEAWMNSDLDYRIIRDREGSFLYEFGRFDSLEEAESNLSDLELHIPVLIVEESSTEAPSHQAIDNGSNKADSEVENSETDELPVDETYTQEFHVSLNSYQGRVIIGENGLTLIDDYNETSIELLYADCDFIKSKGEASLVLTIVTENDEWVVSGVYSDFFELLDQFVDNLS